MKWRDYRQQILSSIDVRAFYVDELKTVGLQYTQRDNEIKGQCPFTELHLGGIDSNPSFTINLTNGVYYCNACGSKGNLHTFYTHIRQVSKQEAWYQLGDALGVERPSDHDTRPGIDPALPVKWHQALLNNTGPIRDILANKRGLTDETLKKFQIGWDGERVTIPVYNEFNELVNIRRYKWNSYEDNTKMINYVDEQDNSYGEDRVYGIEHLVNAACEEVIWCEGEWDRLVAEQYGFPTCTHTAGAHNFKTEWLRLLRTKKHVRICYDNDIAGNTAAEYLTNALGSAVKISVFKWPDKWPDKYDITDVHVKEKYTAEQFLALFEERDEESNLPVVHLAASSNAKYAGKRIKVPVLIAGKAASPFIYPKAVRVSCTGAGKLCEECSLEKRKQIDIHIDSSKAVLLKLIDCSDEQQFATLRRLSGCPAKCREVDFNILEYGNIESVHLIPKADTGFGFATRQEYVTRMGYCIGNNISTNKRFTLVGYMHADPATQRSTYIFDTALSEKGLMDDMEITPELHERLKVFQCAEGQTVSSKFNEIHTDLERNVTYIWNRRTVGYSVDLVYNTAIAFTFQEQRIKRGWAECLIIGDSGQAKTTLVERLMQHYQCGELLSGESSRRTGLVYSIQQTGTKGWSILWGAMPLNDGGLITVDELSGMAEEDLAKMSDVRSSGIAKATGVVTAETTARTRMIFISNPRNGRQLKAENYGVSSILKLFGKAEDVRRLDFAVAVASGEVDADVVNKAVTDMPEIPHVYTSELCKLRTMWAWSRKPDNIVITPEATSAILVAASEMGVRYSSKIPLVEPADQRLKIARLAISAAMSTYSTEDGENVIIKPNHVDFVVEFLNSAYSTRAMGYDRFSADDFENSDTTDSAMAKLRNTYIALPFVSRTPLEIIKALYTISYFSRNTLEDVTGLDRDELKNLMRFLLNNNVAERAGPDYKRTPLGLAFIENILTQPPTEHEIKKAREARFTNSEV